MDSLSGISRSLYGQPWSCWAANKELENDEDSVKNEENQPAADVMRLPKEDMTLFGFCPEQDDFYIVICEICGLGIKPMGMHHHMNLRHSQDNDSVKTIPTSKTAHKELEAAKPKNRKHIAPSNAVNIVDYGLGVGPPQKVNLPEQLVNIANNSKDFPSIRPSSNSKAVKIDGEKLNKINTGIKYNILQNSVDNNVIMKTVGSKMSNTKSSRSSRTVHIEGIKSSKGIQKAVPIKSGFRLQIIDSSNHIVFKRNSKSVLSASSELKVRHRRKHRRNRASSKRGIKNKSSRKVVQLPKVTTGSSPIIAPCPSLAPSPYVALTPLKAIKWSNVFGTAPSQVKVSRNLSTNLHPSIGPGINMGTMHVTKSEEPFLRVLNIDTTASNNMLHSEVRAPALACKHITPVINDMKFCQMQGKNILLPAVLPHAAIRVPDITWSTVHPKPLGVCPLQTRKVGGLVTTDRRLDHVWQSVKSALLEQDAYQTTVLCSASSSQPDFHLNHKSSIKTILASLAANNYTRNSVCKPTNSNLRQLPHGINSEKQSLSSVVDMSSSVMLLTSSNTKSLSNSKSFLPNACKALSIEKLNPTNITTQPYPGIFLRNGHYILPRNFRICLKRRRVIPVVNNIAKKLKEKTCNEMMGNCRNSQNEHCFPRSVPIHQFSIPNGLSEPVNSYIAYPEEGLSHTVPQSKIKLDVVNSISMLTSNRENLCESTGRLSELDQLKNDIMSGFHSIKTASRIVDVNNKAPCRKATSTTTLSNVRLSSSPGTVQVNTSQITYLTAGPVTFQQISPQMIGQIQLQSKPNQMTTSIPLKLISPAQTVSLTTSRTMLLQPEKDES